MGRETERQHGAELLRPSDPQVTDSGGRPAMGNRRRRSVDQPTESSRRGAAMFCARPFRVRSEGPAQRRRGCSMPTRHLDDQDRSLLHSTLTSDTHRKAVLQILILGSHVTLFARRMLPRHRSLTLELAHRRRPSILLDQVFGSWRVEGCSQHNFATNPTTQARRLRTATFRFVERPVSRAPIAKKLD